MASSAPAAHGVAAPVGSINASLHMSDVGAAWVKEVAPRLGCAGGVIGVILVNSTIPQVVSTSGGGMTQLSWSMWSRMALRITPKAGGLKAAQYGVMREMKMALDPITGPEISKILSFGVIGTAFQSVIYNTLIADMYKIYTGKAKARQTFASLVKGVAPGVVWCFGREAFSMGGGLVLQPIVKKQLETRLHNAGIEHVPEFPLRFGAGFLSGACTALGTQWLHNTTLVAGRMAATGTLVEAPHYTVSSLKTTYEELGFRMFYMNFPQRMTLIAGAVALLSLCDIFHRPELRLLSRA